MGIHSTQLEELGANGLVDLGGLAEPQALMILQAFSYSHLHFSGSLGFQDFFCRIPPFFGLSHDGGGLSRASLPIAEQAAEISRENMIDHPLGH